MRKWINALKVLALLVIGGLFVGYPIYAQVSQLNPDPCAAAVSGVSGAPAMLGVPIAEATAETHQLVAPVAGQKVTVCGLVLNSVGGTSQLEYGTGTACTGTHAMTGTFAASSTLTALPTRQMVLGSTPASQGVCIVAGSSTTATGGWMLYIQE